MLDLLKFSISADDRTARAFGSLKGELKGVKGVLAGVGDQAKRVGRNMRNIGLGASAAVTAPLVLAGREALQLFDQQAKAQAAVQQAVASTGGAAGKSADELFRMASGLQNVTTFGDEDILQNVTAPLLTFTKISDDTFGRAQANVLDMATLMKMDLKSASILVGKALNDPVKGLSALSRTGVQFSDDQKDVIKALVETGDIAKAQGLILTELETQFGGQAEAAAKVGLGPLKQLSNAVGDLKEELGAEMVTFLPAVVSKIKSAVEWFSNLSPEVKSNIVVFGGLAATAGPVLALLGAATLGVTALTGAFATMATALLANPLLMVIAGIAGGAYLIYQNWDAVSDWFAGLWERVKSVTSAGWDLIKGVFLNYHPAGIIYSNWDGIAGWFGIQWSSVKAGAQIAWDGIKLLLSGGYSADALVYSLWRGMADWFRDLGPDLAQAFRDLWGAIKAEVGQWPGRMLQIGKDAVQGLIDGLWGGADDVENAGVTTGRNLVRGTKRALDSNSPSKVFIQIGRDVIEGLGIGLRDNANVATDEMSKITDTLIKTGDAGDGLAGQFGSVFASIRKGSDAAKEALRGLLGQLADRALTQVGTSLFSGLFGGLGSLFGGGSVFGSIPGFANGTGSAPGGLAIVGERGRELVNLPRGSQVLPNPKTEQMLNGGAQSLSVSIGFDDSTGGFTAFVRDQAGNVVAQASKGIMQGAVKASQRQMQRSKGLGGL